MAAQAGPARRALHCDTGTAPIGLPPRSVGIAEPLPGRRVLAAARFCIVADAIGKDGIQARPLRRRKARCVVAGDQRLELALHDVAGEILTRRHARIPPHGPFIGSRLVQGAGAGTRDARAGVGICPSIAARGVSDPSRSAVPAAVHRNRRLVGHDLLAQRFRAGVCFDGGKPVVHGPEPAIGKPGDRRWLNR